MKILIKIKNKKVRIGLYENKRERDFLNIKDEYKLSEELLPAVDKILKRNKLSSKDIKIEIESDQNDNFTTTRIAKSVANAWNFSNEKLDKF
jgi:tRNA A37 threonylcarbamoyladenosine modification protein TsaB